MAEPEEYNLYNLISALSESVVNMNEEDAERIADILIQHFGTPQDLTFAVEQGLVKAMQKAGDLYEAGEYFIPDLLMCEETMNTVMALFQPYLKKSDIKAKGRVVIGTIQGDTHDIGKNIVAVLIRAAGYEVFDLGKDVSPESFVHKAIKENADIIAISSLMTTTRNNMEEVIKLLVNQGIKEQFPVVIGGKSVSLEFAKKIGADFYGESVSDTLGFIEKVLNERKTM